MTFKIPTVKNTPALVWCRIFRILTGGGLTLCCLAGLALANPPAPMNRVEKIRVLGEGEVREVRIQTTAEPTFTVFRMNNPTRVVVDISGGDLADVGRPMSVSDGIIGDIATRQFQTSGFSVGRVIVGLETDLAYQVDAEKQAVVIRVGEGKIGLHKRVQPPPAAPVDREAVERFEKAKADAKQALAEAQREKELANRAAKNAEEKIAESKHASTLAEQALNAARQAQEEVRTLRESVAVAASEDQKRAQLALAMARSELAGLNKRATALVASREAAEKEARDAKVARLKMETDAARAKLEHRNQMAEVKRLKEELARDRLDIESARSEVAEARRQVEEAREEHREQNQRLAEARQNLNTQRSSLEERRKSILAAEADMKRLRTLQLEEASRLKALQEILESEKNSLRRARHQTDVLEKNATQTLATQQEQLQEVRKLRKELKAQRDELEAAKRRVESKQRVAESTHRNYESQLQRIEALRGEVAGEKSALVKARQKLEASRLAADDAAAAHKKELATLGELQSRLEAERKTLEKSREELVRDRERARQKMVRHEASNNRTVAKPPVKVAGAPAAEVAGAFHGVQVMENGDLLLKLSNRPAYDSKSISGPPRLVFDFKDTGKAIRQRHLDTESPFVRRVRLGRHGNNMRAVLDLKQSGLAYQVESVAQGLRIRWEKMPEQSAAVRVAHQPSSKAAPRLHVLEDVQFDSEGMVSTIALDIGEGVEPKLDARSKRSLVLKLPNTRLKKGLERSLDTASYQGSVRLVSVYQASGDTVNVVANLTGQAKPILRRQGRKLLWEIRGSKPGAVSHSTAPMAAGFAGAAQALAKSTPAQSRSRRRMVNFDLKDAEIVNVIRLISDISGENIITNDDVKGRVTIRLRNVPWDTALDTILRTNGYDYVRRDNILRVAPAQAIAREREEEAKAKRALELVEDTILQNIRINYAEAGEISGLLQPILSSRGNVQVDARTNTILVEEIASNIPRVINRVRSLDRQTPQVLIEARIVEATANNVRELGIQWGGSTEASARNGNPTGLFFPGDIRVAGAANDTPGTSSPGVGSPAQYAVNLPAAIGAGSGGGIGFVFGSAGGGDILNLRLSALERSGQARIVSSPRVTTLDNKTATISSGKSIPFQTTTAVGGASTQFVQANLELQVTPHVTNDGSISMEIQATKNEPDPGLSVLGQPSITRKEAQTEVLVKDGDTTVIGGIYTKSTSESEAGVPFLSSIPILGALFKTTSKNEIREELLIFVTPRIVNREAALADGRMSEEGL